jgi:hypothetical protein
MCCLGEAVKAVAVVEAAIHLIGKPEMMARVAIHSVR